jgi:pimeloyl-ACP methyl ester carboxylesterase
MMHLSLPMASVPSFAFSSVPVSHFAVIDGVRLHWAELGHGRPLVLLHGLCDSHRTWFPVAPELARSRRVLMLDLAGCGESARPDASYTLDWHANLVGAWLGALGLDAADLVGHSFGGGVAQWMLLHHRRRIRRLGLESSGGLGREVGPALRWASFPFFVERFGQPFMRFGTTRALNAAGGAFSGEEIAILARYNAVPGTARAFSRSVRDVIDAWGQHRNFLDRAHEVPVLPPVAIFWGDKDPLIPIAHGIDAASVIEGATLTRVQGVGHFPHRQVPGPFAQALEALLDAPHVANARLRDGRPPAGGRSPAHCMRASSS